VNEIVLLTRTYMNDSALQNRVTEIIRPLVPPDAEERVNRSFKQWNQTVRDHIRTETGLKRVVQQIKAIHEDILGVYRFSPGQGSSVELYWLPMAMAAAMLDVRIEDLTVVVLIHELAHGYTHIGRDIDGASWSDIGFGESELAVTEGLAQFYTEVISERLAARMPSLFTAYHSLLKLQSGPYLVHRDWLKGDRRQIGETVRFTLIAARSQGRVRYDHWQELMAETSNSLMRHSPFGG
jgi:hypothetical protein